MNKRGMKQGKKDEKMPVLMVPGIIAGATFLVIWVIRRYRKGSTKTNSRLPPPPPPPLPEAQECGPVASTKPNLTPAPLSQPRLYAQESQQYNLVASSEPDLTLAPLGPPPLYAQQSQHFSTIVVSSEQPELPRLLVQCCPPDGDRGLKSQYYAGQEFDLGGHDKDSDSE
ncbi:hypothetical protein ISN44_As01g010840 [Arabidopsis suecica]|uniref:Transmembrane protein n=1 Tax=Arabidopsis suecica TaxID=45249 RepID=A0A8T2H2A8_ARASU|nr:hypothetical protein ISN44_As01g010840 [Arabidopsis suecica]